jgi:hypothetical protein
MGSSYGAGSALVARAGAPARPSRGRTWLPPLVRGPAFGVYWNLYTNGGAGPVNYDVPIATLPQATLTWSSTYLAYPGTWQFALRAATANGLEQNLDAAVTILLDATGKDVTNRPAPPVHLRALPRAGGAARVEWWYPTTAGPTTPAGFHVYIGVGASPSYTSPVAIVAYSTGYLNTFKADLTGLTGGTAYSVGVRAYNATGEEPNTIAVGFTAGAAGPLAVSSLSSSSVV